MKKSIIAGVAAFSMAALPVAGVFAVGSSTVTDNVQLTVGEGCTMTSTDNGNAGAGTYNLGAVTEAGGVLAEVKGTEMFVSCNTTNGWTLSAAATALNGPEAIAFGAPANSGDTSVWSARLEGSNGISLNTTSTASGLTGVTAGGKVVGGKITPYYSAYVKANATAGTYAGSITYTFTAK